MRLPRLIVLEHGIQRHQQLSHKSHQRQLLGLAFSQQSLIELGEVCPELAVTLTRQGRDWVPVPELLYLSAKRFPNDWDQDGACSVPPDLVMEIISPGQTFGQMAAKAQDCLDAQVLRVWVVDSTARSITVFYPDAPPQIYMGNTLLTNLLFEGLEFSPKQVFQQARIPSKD